MSTPYIGRFAPSPTGRLHIGSLIGALASYLDAKAHHGFWLVRIEDLDPPREIPGAAQAILDSLISHGLQWDGEVLWQSQRHHAYQNTIEQLLTLGHAYYCSCSRSDIAAHGSRYSGHCRGKTKRHDHPDNQACAIRLQITDQTLAFIDGIQGHYQQQLNRDVGDFVIQRKDGLYAYQLAVVMDDHLQGITHIVRGSDLIDSTPRQIFLQHQLGLNTPHYAHIPVITNSNGQKHSKQTFAKAIDSLTAPQNLLRALYFLGQPTPPLQRRLRCQDILEWAVSHWQPNLIKPCLAIAE